MTTDRHIVIDEGAAPNGQDVVRLERLPGCECVKCGKPTKLHCKLCHKRGKITHVCSYECVYKHEDEAHEMVAPS